jgi:hypothetical protein
MSKVKIIAFIGKMGSGKTTAGMYLAQNHGYLRLRFADKLKAMLVTLGLTEEEVDGDLKSKPCILLGGKTPRHAMITLGTEWGRDMIDQNLWVNALAKELANQIVQGECLFVIDDLRFLSEANWLRSLDERISVKLVRILRTNVEKVDHQSETEQEHIAEDWMMFNEYALKDLYNKIDDYLETINKE